MGTSTLGRFGRCALFVSGIVVFGISGIIVFGAAANAAHPAMAVSSTDFRPDAEIPASQIYPRCGGANISPQLTWSGAPTSTQSFVLTMIDVSVKPSYWSHWIVTDLPPDTRSIARGSKDLPAGAQVVPNSFGDARYDGPCPPEKSGKHEYQVTIWAMPAPSSAISPQMKPADLRSLLEKNSLAHATLTGFVAR
ncbi:MAG TPA: YbhB/YbcL family Raf kinase inhibitor-like protein [Steroidobacteraceae bacterium]|jgi:hypothetical protein|nr:YbhB/YbcL family Raf kinase inhibitor-like protein [Steroidobacteraceae bacterium]